MMIREQAKKIQLLRTHYIPEKKRTESKMFASMSILIDDINSVDTSILKMLDKKEKEKLVGWFQKRKEKQKMVELEDALNRVAETMSKAILALSNKTIASNFSQNQVNEIEKNINLLDKVLKKPSKLSEQIFDDKNETDIKIGIQGRELQFSGSIKIL